MFKDRRVRRMGIAGASVAMVTLVAACGGGSTGGGTSPAAEASSAAADYSQKGPITFARAKDNSGYAPKEVGAWNELHPDQQVTLRDLPDSADQQRQQIIQNAQIKSDELSVVTTDVVWTAEFAANGYIDELPGAEFPLTGFLPAAVDTAKYFDKLYAVPGDSNGGLLYYRKDLLGKAGVQPPTTWEEMKQACAKVKQLPGSSGIGCYGAQFNKYEGLTVNFAEAVDSSGGRIIGDDGKPSVNTPEAARGLSFLVDAFKDGTIPRGAITWQEEQGRQAFQNGELVFLRNWSYVYGLAGKTDGSSKIVGKFAVAPLPGLSGPGVSSLGGLNFAIPKYARNKGTAVEFIKFLSAPEEQKKRVMASANPPTIESLYTDADLVKQYPYLPTLLTSIQNANPRPKVVKYGDLTLAIQDAAYSALQGQVQPADALAQLQSRLEPLV